MINVIIFFPDFKFNNSEFYKKTNFLNTHI